MPGGLERRLRASAAAWVLLGPALAVAAPPSESDAPPTESEAPDETSRVRPPTKALRALSAADFGRDADSQLDAPLVFGDEERARLWDEVGGRGWLFAEKRWYVYDAAAQTWTSHPWPKDFSALDASFVGEDLYVVGESGGLLRRVDERHFDRRVISGVDPRTRRLDFQRIWARPSGDRMWILAGLDRLVAVDLPSGVSVVYPIPVADGGAHAAAGQPCLIGRVDEGGEGGDVVVVSTGPAIYRHRHGEVVHLASMDASVEALAFAPDGVSVEARLAEAPLDGAPLGDEAADGSSDDPSTDAGDATRASTDARSTLESTTHNVSLEPPARDEGAPLSRDDDRLMDAMSRRDNRSENLRKGPAAETFWFPSLRISPGIDMRFDEPRASYGMEVGLGVMLAPRTDRDPDFRHGSRATALWLWPELGYAYAADARGLGHGLFAGLGVGVGNDFVTGYYKPRVVVGAFDRGAEFGFRHGLSAQTFWGVVGLELSHGMAFGRLPPEVVAATDATDARTRHDLRLALDVNLVPLVWAVILLARPDR